MIEHNDRIEYTNPEESDAHSYAQIIEEIMNGHFTRFNDFLFEYGGELFLSALHLAIERKKDALQDRSIELDDFPANVSAQEILEQQASISTKINNLFWAGNEIVNMHKEMLEAKK